MRIVLSLVFLLATSISPAWTADAAKPAAAPTAVVAKEATTTAAPELAKTDAQDTKTAEAPKSSLAQYLDHGGIIAYILLITGLVMVVVVIERMINIRRGNFLMSRQNFDAALLAWNSKDYAKVKAIADKEDNIQSDIITFMADNPTLPSEVLIENINDKASRGVQQHQSRAYYLNIVAALSPLLGLLGTIIGMIISFNKIAAAGDVGDTSMVAGGISMALINTAFGLIVAVPALTMYHICRLRLNGLTLKLEDACAETAAKFLQTKTDK